MIYKTIFIRFLRYTESRYTAVFIHVQRHRGERLYHSRLIIELNTRVIDIDDIQRWSIRSGKRRAIGPTMTLSRAAHTRP